MSVKIKGMDIPGDCASCPLLVLDTWGYRRCFALDQSVRAYDMDERQANCPIEEVED